MVPSDSASSEMSSSPKGADNSALVKQCLEFCQTLASMGADHQPLPLHWLKLQYFLEHQQGYHHPGLQEG